jgi:hypothetical protein
MPCMALTKDYTAAQNRGVEVSPSILRKTWSNAKHWPGLPWRRPATLVDRDGSLHYARAATDHHDVHAFVTKVMAAILWSPPRRMPCWTRVCGCFGLAVLLKWCLVSPTDAPLPTTFNRDLRCAFQRENCVGKK